MNKYGLFGGGLKQRLKKTANERDVGTFEPI